MAVFSGPEIPNDGLVFYYDMYNTQRSWKGKPTTNLLDAGLGAVQMVSLAYVGLEDGWKKYSLNGTWTAGTYPYAIAINGPTFTGGVSYSSSCYVKTNVMHKFNYFGTGMNYVNQPMNKTGTSFGVLQPDGSYYCGRSDFEYTSSTPQAGYILSNPIANSVFSSATDFVWLKDAQVEQGSFPTPFAGWAGSRTNTQAVLDLTNNNTIVANSLTYASNNTFSFNGTTDRIYTSTNTTYGNNTTWEAWVNRTASLDTYNTFMGRYLPYFGIMSDNKIIFSNRLGGTQQTVYSTNFTAVNNTWYHLVFTTEFDGTNTTSRIYINGVLNNSRTAAGAQGNEAYAFTVGIWYPTVTTSPFQGRVDSVKVYNRTLTAAEISQSFEATRSRYNL